ncbi:MAG: hypothetical protein ABIO40_02015 [Devosia sp.]
MPVDIAPPDPVAVAIPHFRKLAFLMGVIATMLVIAALQLLLR